MCNDAFTHNARRTVVMSFTGEYAITINDDMEREFINANYDDISNMLTIFNDDAVWRLREQIALHIAHERCESFLNDNAHTMNIGIHEIELQTT